MMVSRFIPLLKKGFPEKSRLYEVVESGEMPIRERLHDKEIEFISNWIKACAPKESVTSIPESCNLDDDNSDDDDFDDDNFDDDTFDVDTFDEDTNSVQDDFESDDF